MNPPSIVKHGHRMMQYFQLLRKCSITLESQIEDHFMSSVEECGREIADRIQKPHTLFMRLDLPLASGNLESSPRDCGSSLPDFLCAVTGRVVQHIHACESSRHSVSLHTSRSEDHSLDTQRSDTPSMHLIIAGCCFVLNSPGRHSRTWSPSLPLRQHLIASTTSLLCTRQGWEPYL